MRDAVRPPGLRRLGILMTTTALALTMGIAPTSASAAGEPGLLLDVSFAGTFTGAAYAPTADETVDGAVSLVGTAAAGEDGVTLTGGTAGVKFVPTTTLSSPLNQSVLVEVVATRDSRAAIAGDTLISIGGQTTFRHNPTAGTWQYQTVGPQPYPHVEDSAPTPATTLQHYALVYTALSSSSSSVELYVGGVQVGETKINSSLASVAASAIGFGMDVHPGATSRGFHGVISEIAASTFIGVFAGPSAFRLDVPDPSEEPGGPVDQGESTYTGGFANHIAVDADDNDATLVDKAAHVIPTAEQLEWQQREQIAFIHFNMPTFIGVEGGDGRTDIAKFDPTDLDTDQWAAELKAQGIKLAILTVKHADGLILFPTSESDYNVSNTPYGEDLLRQFTDSLHAADIGVGVYYSPLNRHAGNVVESSWAPGYPLYGFSSVKGTRPCSVPAVPVEGKPSFEYQVDEYNCTYMRQLYELFSNYGDIDEWWIDGSATSYTMAAGSWDAWRPADWPNATGSRTQQYNNSYWYEIARTLQPKMLFFGGWDIRWVGTEAGMARAAGEWSVIPTSSELNSYAPVPVAGSSSATDLGGRDKLASARYLTWHPAEADTPILAGENWFYPAPGNTSPKSPEKLWQTYLGSVGRNSVLLLNLSPDKTGAIPQNQIDALKKLRQRVQDSFGADLAAGAQVTRSDDGKQITLALPEEKTFDYVTLQENVGSTGQRVEKFTVQAKVDGAWKTIGTGNMVGYKRIQSVTRTTASEVRITVDESRLDPDLIAYQLHLASDASAPFTTASVDGTLGEDGWYTKAPTVTLKAEDAEGVAETTYRIGDGAWQTYQGPIELPEGTSTLQFSSVDVQGHAEVVRTLDPIRVDLTAPAVSATADAGARTITVTAEDATSGVASIEFSLDGGESWQPYAEPIAAGPDGISVLARATDAAGLRSTTDEAAVIDPDASQPRIIVDPHATVGSSVAVRLQGFEPGAVVEIWLESEPILWATVTMDAEGAYSDTLVLPEELPAGAHRVIARIAGEDVAETSIEVAAVTSPGKEDPAGGSPDGHGALAQTGSPAPLVYGALALALLGLGVVLAARRRSRA